MLKTPFIQLLDFVFVYFLLHRPFALALIKIHKDTQVPLVEIEKSPSQRLKSIVNSVDAVDRYLENVSESEFVKNQEKIDAVCLHLTGIGEHVYHLYSIGYFDNLYTKNFWKRIADFRHLTKNNYHFNKTELLWTFAKLELWKSKVAMRPHMKEINSKDLK